MKRVVVSVVLAILGTMAFAQSRGVVDGGYAASKSFGAQSAMLKEKFGIELTIPEGFVDRTFGTSKVYTLSNQPETRIGSKYVSCISNPDKSCVILYEDYPMSSRQNKLMNLYPQDWLMREELGLALALEEDPLRQEVDFRKVMMHGEGLTVEDSDVEDRIKMLEGQGVESVAYFTTELTPRADALLRHGFLRDQSVGQIYDKCICVYFLLPNGVCHSAKIFMTEKANADAAKFLESLVAASSYLNMKDDCLAKRDGGILYNVYSNEQYKGESDSVYCLDKKARESIVASFAKGVPVEE